MNFGASGADSKLSLLQRQKALEEERLKQQAKQGATASQSASKEDEFWESLGQGKSNTTTDGFSNTAGMSTFPPSRPLG